MISLLQKWDLLQASLADPGLSPRAKLVLGAMLGCLNIRTGCCHPSVDFLAGKTACKRRVVSDAIAELVAGGWLTVKRRRGSAVYTLALDRGSKPNDVRNSAHHHPSDDVQNSAHLPDLDDVQDSAHHRERRDSDDVRDSACLHAQDSAPLIDSESSSQTQISVKGTRESDSVSAQPGSEPVEEAGRGSAATRSPRRAKARSAPTGEAFAEFWDAYPRKAGKLDARKAFDEAVKGGRVTAAELIDGARRYAQAVAAEGREPQFVKQPAGWLRAERWTDGPPDVDTAPPAAPPRAKRSAFVEAVLNTVRQS